jgi:hypothetical protein
MLGDHRHRLVAPSVHVMGSSPYNSLLYSRVSLYKVCPLRYYERHRRHSLVVLNIVV